MKRSSKIILVTLAVVGISGTVMAFGGKQYCNNMNAEEKADMINYRISRKLDLNSEQEVYLESLTGRVAEIAEQAREDRETRQQWLEDLISDQPFDQSTLLQKVNEKTDMVKQNAPEVITLLGQFVDSLDSEQKSELKDLISKRGGFGGRGFGGRHHNHWIDG